MSGIPVPPPPRLMGLDGLTELPGAPSLGHFPPGTLGELIITGLTGDDERLTAHVAVHIETPTALAEWMTMMPFEEFLELLPVWTLLNPPSHAGEVEPAEPASAHPQRRGTPRRRRIMGGEELAASWRGRGRPTRATAEYLLTRIELVPNAVAVDYLEAVRRVRGKRFDETSRSLIASVCDIIAAAEKQPPTAA